MSEKPFGIDVSRWQGRLNWDAIASATNPQVQFCAIRASISWGYTDSWFQRNWQESKRVKIIRCAYHVLYPGESPDKQMEHFLRIVGNDFGELPMVLDCELSHNKSPDQIQAAILSCASIIQSKTGKKPIIYSRANWVDQFISAKSTPPAWLNDYDWWLANYLIKPEEHPGPPAMPKGLIRERVLIHQTTDKGVSIGSDEKYMDYNRWQFDQSHLEKYAGVKTRITLEDKVNLLWAAHPELQSI